MKVAIIGAAGFVGTRIIESFHLGEGPTPVAIVRHPSRLALPARFVIDLRIADALDVDSLARSLAGCSAAVHVARGDAAQNKRMPVVLCRAAAQAGVRRVVYLSSASVHGQNPPPGTDEKSPLHLRHEIEGNNARVAAERSFFAECRQLALTGYALRPAVLFGPRSRFIADRATELHDERAWLLQNGRGICNSLYIDNLVTAVRLCLKAKNGAGQPYLLTDAETVTWHEFYHTLARHLDLSVKRIHAVDAPPAARAARKGSAPAPGPGPAPTQDLPDEWFPPAPPPPAITAELAALQQCSWRLPSTRAVKQLGYQPAVSFAEAMRRTCAWWRFAQGVFPATA